LTIIGISYCVIRHKRLSAAKNLPLLIQKHFLDALTSVLYKKREPSLLVKELSSSGVDRARFDEIFNNILSGEKLILKKIYAVCPERLLSSFSNYRNNIVRRLEDNKDLFQREDWRKNDPDKRREWIRKVFDEKIKRLNDENDLAPVLIAVHGTSLEVAWKICQNGFAAIPKENDKGWYGKGIYFTTFVTYVLPYLKSGSPAVVVACVMPGNPYPVIEGRDHPDNLNGAALKQGCQSHYVLTNGTGEPCSEILETGFYDELVIDQEGQVVPMYIVEIDNSNFGTLIRDLDTPKKSTARRTGFVGTDIKLDEKSQSEYKYVPDDEL